MPFQLDLSDRVVLVTGATSGIGLGVARQFARAGAAVFRSEVTKLVVR